MTLTRKRSFLSVHRAAVILAITGALSGAPALAASPVDKFLGDDTAIANGKLRFAQNCNYCHGADGIGGKHKKLQCRNFKPDYVFDTISSGLQQGSYFMPPWDHFSEDQRWELVAFILSLGQLDSCG